MSDIIPLLDPNSYDPREKGFSVGIARAAFELAATWVCEMCERGEPFCKDGAEEHIKMFGRYHHFCPETISCHAEGIWQKLAAHDAMKERG